MKTTITIIAALLLALNLSAQCIDGDCLNGNGIFIYDDYSVYVGQFSGGKAAGEGTCYYANGERYTGNWANHYFNGEGILTLADGTAQAGTWTDGELTAENTAIIPQTSSKPNVYAVVVGVAAYTAMQPLNFTDDDAYRMLSHFKSPEGGALGDDQIRVLIDENATKAKIIKAMHEIYSQATPNDEIMFYYSGHGFKQAFLPFDYDGTNNQLHHAEVMNIINASTAKTKVCIVDACHSGGLNKEANKMDEGMLAMKGSIEDLLESYYSALNVSKGGTAFILSSKAEESSIEHKGFRQGVFTHFLIRGLKGEADVDADRIVTVGEIYHFVNQQVKQYTSNYQTPVYFGNASEKTPLAVVR